MSMFCYQCEQTSKGTGCTVHGVCGKDPQVAALQDLLVYALKGLSMYAHRAGQLGVTDREANARRIIEAEDWRLYLMDAADVERELLRLHQFRKLHYEVAGSLAQIKLPAASAAEYVREIG